MPLSLTEDLHQIRSSRIFHLRPPHRSSSVVSVEWMLIKWGIFSCLRCSIVVVFYRDKNNRTIRRRSIGVGVSARETSSRSFATTGPVSLRELFTMISTIKSVLIPRPPANQSLRNASREESSYQ